MTDTREAYVVTRTMAAPPEKIFALLANPARHKDTEPGEWVRDAIDGDPITGTGQIFAMNMYFDRAGGDYVVHNVVTEFEPNRAIAWRPGSLDESGRAQPRRLVLALRAQLPTMTEPTSRSPTTGRTLRRRSATRSVECRSSAGTSSRSHSPPWNDPWTDSSGNTSPRRR